MFVGWGQAPKKGFPNGEIGSQHRERDPQHREKYELAVSWL